MESWRWTLWENEQKESDRTSGTGGGGHAVSGVVRERACFLGQVPSRHENKTKAQRQEENGGTMQGKGRKVT
jgi:hypothetical protein